MSAPVHTYPLQHWGPEHGPPGGLQPPPSIGGPESAQHCGEGPQLFMQLPVHPVGTQQKPPELHTPEGGHEPLH
jgi:hypothetical protein